MLGAIWLIFALDQKLELAAETLVLLSGPKFMCLVVHFNKYFWFWYQTRIVPEKVYAAIWPVLEITSLKYSIWFQSIYLPTKDDISENVFVKSVSFFFTFRITTRDRIW